MQQAPGKLANPRLLQRLPPKRSHSSGLLPNKSSNRSLSKSQSQVRMSCHLKDRLSRCEAGNLKIRLRLRLSIKRWHFRTKVSILCSLRVTQSIFCVLRRAIWEYSGKEKLLESSQEILVSSRSSSQLQQLSLPSAALRTWGDKSLLKDELMMKTWTRWTLLKTC